MTVLIESDPSDRIIGIDVYVPEYAVTKEQVQEVKEHLSEQFDSTKVSNEVNNYKSYLSGNVELYFPETFDFQFTIK